MPPRPGALPSHPQENRTQDMVNEIEIIGSLGLPDQIDQDVTLDSIDFVETEENSPNLNDSGVNVDETFGFGDSDKVEKVVLEDGMGIRTNVLWTDVAKRYIHQDLILNVSTGD